MSFFFLPEESSTPKLPIDVLEQVIGYLKLDESIDSESPEWAHALANTARVSRLFYRLAMSLL